MDGRDPPFDLSFRIHSDDHRALWRATRRSGVEQMAALLPVLAITALAAFVGEIVGSTSGKSDAVAWGIGQSFLWGVCSGSRGTSVEAVCFLRRESELRTY